MSEQADVQAENGRTQRNGRGWTALFVAAVAIAAAALVALAVIGASYLEGQQKYARIAEHADLGAIDEDGGGARIDWDALLAINPDTVAWLRIPGTAIDYPVVKGADNDYYLSHDFEGDEGWIAQYGAIFLDFRNDPAFGDDASFIYGHHMNDGSMFAGLAELADPLRFNEARDVYLFTPAATFKLRTFSLVHCADDDPIVQTSFATPEEMAAYAQDKIDRSLAHPGDVPAAESIGKLFAFATCDNNSGGRYVLFACPSE